jgi:hypothetical protein
LGYPRVRLVGERGARRGVGRRSDRRQPALLILNTGFWPPRIACAQSNFQRVLTENGFVCEYDCQPNFAARNNSDIPTLVKSLSQFDLVIVVGSQECENSQDRVPTLSQALTAALVEYNR